MITTKENLHQLCTRWEKWCRLMGYKCISADDFLVSHGDFLSPVNHKYVRDFIASWDEAEKAGRD